MQSSYLISFFKNSHSLIIFFEAKIILLFYFVHLNLVVIIINFICNFIAYQRNANIFKNIYG